MDETIPKCFDIAWQDLPEENQLAYLTRWHEYCLLDIYKMIDKGLYSKSLQQALQNLS